LLASLSRSARSASRARTAFSAASTSSKGTTIPQSPCSTIETETGFGVVTTGTPWARYSSILVGTECA